MMPSGVSPGWTMRLDRPSAQVEASTSQVSAWSARVAPVAAGELVLDQPVLRRRVGHAEKRLGKHHQRQSLARREAVFAQEVLEPADHAGLAADRLDVAGGAGVDLRLGRGIEPRLGDEAADQGRVIGGVGCVEDRQGDRGSE